MQIKVNFLENLRLEALFDDYKVLTDQPIRYKGDGMAPSPFDYFLASSALCAAYFIKVYCKTREIPTNDIKLTQDNIVDPENRYQQTFRIQVEVPAHISTKDKEGIIRAIDRCTVKKTIQQSPEFIIEVKESLSVETEDQVFKEFLGKGTKTLISGKDAPLETTIEQMTKQLKLLGIKIEISSWRNPVANVWSVHIRDADSPLCFSNGKGASKEAALCSALGEYLERLSTNYFYSDFYLGQKESLNSFVHYPEEKWFKVTSDNLPAGVLNEKLLNHYNPSLELKASHLIDLNSGNQTRGICALPFINQGNGKTIYFPVNLIANLYASNGMSAGNSLYEARVQALCEIFERAVKNQIIREELTLPDVPIEILKSYPKIYQGICDLEKRGFPIIVKDASLGGKYPVMNVTLMNPKTGGVFASFGAHPNFEIALERSLTELMQGRSFEGLNDVAKPTFNSLAVSEENNIIDHFIDSTGIISWRFFSDKPHYQFHHWNFKGATQEEFNYLCDLIHQEGKEIYIADYSHLGSYACRIIVPGYSEIYQVDDLVWDNSNRALLYRDSILNLHRLNEEEVISLLEDLENSELDEQMPVCELIGISFDDNTPWAELTLGELKARLYLKTKNYQMTHSLLEMINTFNEFSDKRKKFYQFLYIYLESFINDDIEWKDYEKNLAKMYHQDIINMAKAWCLDGTVFSDLTPTDLNLTGIDKHQRLLKSYQKIQKQKKNYSTIQ